jgi:hypothetical protein
MNSLFSAGVWDHCDMRYLNLNMILASTVLLTFACGDSGGTDAAEETGTGTASETASGDGDGDPGDGDGDPGDGDGDGGDGDGDGGDGDGDGDGGDGDGDGGDGDGDGDAGDGDGDLACDPVNDTECAVCTAENCCDQITACQEDEDCACLSGCIAEGNDPIMCFEDCGVEPMGMMNPQLGALRMCTEMNCQQQCAMP